MKAIEMIDIEDGLEIMKLIEGGYTVDEATKIHFSTKGKAVRLNCFYNKNYNDENYRNDLKAFPLPSNNTIENDIEKLIIDSQDSYWNAI